ncbi:hypothetical protein C8R43DRAFT_975274 [Mycena crocata]|nr:hypothetical protein C8R43DRAFT_975274 [Mycena crocata]
MAHTRTLSVVIGILLSYSRAILAVFIPPTATIAGSFSVVSLTDNEASTTDSGQSLNPPIPPTPSAAATSVAISPANGAPVLQPDTSPLSYKLQSIILLNNPVIVTSLIILIMALTILVAVIFRVCRSRRRWRAIRDAPLPPPPDVYLTYSKRSLSIRNVAISPMGSPITPRPPSPVLSLFSQTSGSDPPSSDIHLVQREVRGLSFVPGNAYHRTSVAASRSSLGTTRTRPASGSPLWSAEAMHM